MAVKLGLCQAAKDAAAIMKYGKQDDTGRAILFFLLYSTLVG